MDYTSKPKFQLGKIEISFFAQMYIERAGQKAEEFLARHQGGNWGEVCDEDKKANDKAIKNEGCPGKQQQVLSSFVTSFNEYIWIITEPDRSRTTILVPYEFERYQNNESLQ